MLWRKKQDMQCVEIMYDTLDRVPKKGLTEKVAVESRPVETVMERTV